MVIEINSLDVWHITLKSVLHFALGLMLENKVFWSKHYFPVVQRDRSTAQGSFCELSVSGTSQTLSEKLIPVLVTSVWVYIR